MSAPSAPHAAMAANARSNGPRRGTLGCTTISSTSSSGSLLSPAGGSIPPIVPSMRDWLLMSDTWREWTVAGALLETDAGLLMVRNVRKGGIEDWSTPGGVVDADDASVL